MRQELAVTDRFSRASDRRFLTLAVTVAVVAFLVGKRLGAPGKGVAAAGFAAGDAVGLELYRSSAARRSLATSLGCILAAQILALATIRETTALYHGANVMPVALASFLALASLISTLHWFGSSRRS